MFGKTKSPAEPVTLRRWTVMAVVAKGGGRTRHVWGHDVAADECRVSEPVVGFTMENMTVTTANGTQYRLGGLPGQFGRGRPVWEEWCKARGVMAEVDVTTEYMDPDDVSTRQFMALNVSALSAKDPSNNNDK